MDFRKCQQHFEFAIRTIFEKGSLSELGKADLSTMLDKVWETATKNEDIRTWN